MIKPTTTRLPGRPPLGAEPMVEIPIKLHLPPDVAAWYKQLKGKAALLRRLIEAEHKKELP